MEEWAARFALRVGKLLTCCLRAGLRELARDDDEVNTSFEELFKVKA